MICPSIVDQCSEKTIYQLVVAILAIDFHTSRAKDANHLLACRGILDLCGQL